MVNKLLALMLVSPVITSCVTISPSLPTDYSGPTAMISDSVKQHSVKKSEFYYVEKVDGKVILDSHNESLRVNRGRGAYMDPVVLRRKVPARPVTLSVVARTEYATGFLALTKKVYRVKGDIKFTPIPNRTYFVKGMLGKSYSAVWLVDGKTKKVVGKKIVAKGSAKLGFFKK